MKTSFFALISSVLFIFLFTPQHIMANGGDCIATLASRSGTVYAGGPAIETFTSSSDEIEVIVNKKDGKAQTIVNIYVNNVKKKDIVFNNGKDSPKKTKIVKGCLNKTVRIEIVNQSVANKFKYKLTVKGEQGSSLGERLYSPAPQVTKTITFDKACDPKVSITLDRTSGSAKATVYYYIGNSQQGDAVVWEKDQNKLTKILTGTAGKKVKIEVKNISVANRLSFWARAVQ